VLTACSQERKLTAWDIGTGRVIGITPKGWCNRWDDEVVTEHPTYFYSRNGLGVGRVFRRAFAWLDVPTGRIVSSFPLGQDSYGFALSPDGTYLAEVSRHMATLWRVPDGKRLNAASLPCEAYGETTAALPGNGRGGLQFSDNGEWVAAVCRAEVLAIPVSHWARPIRLPHRDVLSFTFSKNSTRLATGDLAGAVRIWDLSSGDPIRMLPNDGNVGAIAFSPDDRWAIVTAWQSPDIARRAGEVRLFDLYDYIRSEVRRFSYDEGVSYATFIDSSRFVVRTDSAALIYTTSADRVADKFVPSGWISQLAFSADARFLTGVDVHPPSRELFRFSVKWSGSALR
jgi:WD40 repeat protein